MQHPCLYYPPHAQKQHGRMPTTSTTIDIIIMEHSPIINISQTFPNKHHRQQLLYSIADTTSDNSV